MLWQSWKHFLPRVVRVKQAAAIRRLIDYVRRCWLLKASVGPTRLSVSGRIRITNNGVESFHNTFSFHAFLEHLQEVTLSNMADVQRLHNPQIEKESQRKA